MRDISNRIDVLANAIRRRQMEQGEPIDEFSKSLMELAAEMASLDAQGKADLLAELNQDGTQGLNLTMEDLEQLARGLEG